MDPKISELNFERRNGLCYCHEAGVAYQPNMSRSVEYNRAYFEKYIMYETLPTGIKLNEIRVNVVKTWAKNLKIIDVGVGCGTFVKNCLAHDLDIHGFDINPCAVHWLNKIGVFGNPYDPNEKYACYTFWDSLEHISEPQKILEKIALGSYVFISMPIFENLEDITKSKHYRPDEHYYYFTQNGLLRWMSKYKFKLLRSYDFEQECGRKNIKTFLFERVIKSRSFLSEVGTMFLEKLKKGD